jgi:O-antigen/teichoic acid export membrane protein
LAGEGGRTFTALVASQALVAGTGLIATRYLSPPEKGLFTAAYLWALAAQTVLGLSLPNAVLYYGAASGRSRPTWRLFAILEAACLGAGAALAMAIGWGNDAGLAFVVILGLLPSIELAFEVISYTALVEGGAFGLYRLCQSASFAGLGIPLVYVMHSATLLLGALLMSYALPLAARVAARERGSGESEGSVKLETRAMLRWALRAHPGLVLSLLASRLDLLLVSLLLPPVFAGQYSAAVAIPSLLTYGGTALGLSLARRVTIEGRGAALPRLGWRLQFLLGLGSLAAGGALIAGAHLLIVGLFGERYSAAVPIVMPLALALPLWNVSAYQTQLLSAIGRPTHQSVGQGLAAVVLLAGSAAAVVLRNLNVVAWSNVGAYACAATWQGISLWRFRIR